ncbi:hypothetical protein C0J52_18564, partial [Blattella germanica]
STIILFTSLSSWRSGFLLRKNRFSQSRFSNVAQFKREERSLCLQLLIYYMRLYQIIQFQRRLFILTKEHSFLSTVVKIPYFYLNYYSFYASLHTIPLLFERTSDLRDAPTERQGRR